MPFETLIQVGPRSRSKVCVTWTRHVVTDNPLVLGLTLTDCTQTDCHLHNIFHILK